MPASALAAWITCWALGFPTLAQGQSVEREWRVRELARDPRAAVDALREGRESEDWGERAVPLDALSRSARAGDGALNRNPDLGSLVVAACSDRHPNVRELALDLLGIDPERGALDELRCRALAADPAPHVRLALASYLGRASGPFEMELLAELGHDPDLHVAERARRALLVRGGQRAEAAKWGIFASSGPRAWPAALSALARAEVSGEFLARLREECERRASSGSDADLALAAWVEALRSRFDPGCGDAALLARGFSACATRWPTSRVQLAAGVACGGKEAGLALLTASCAAGPGEFRHLLDGALEALDGMELLSRYAEQDCLETSGFEIVWSALRGRATSWDEGRVRELLAIDPTPAVIEAAARTVGDTFVRTADPGSARLLTAWLADDTPALFDLAFRSLGQARDPRPWLADLHRAWARFPARDQVRLLAHLPRRGAPDPFREDLLHLAETRPSDRGAVAELLGLFAGDDGVRRALERWLEEEVQALEGPARGNRGRELRASGLLRAVRASGGPRARPALEEAAARMSGVSTNVARVAIHSLGTLEGGAGFLRSRLEVERVPRLAVEIALALTPLGDEAAGRVLVERFPTGDWELDHRVVQHLRHSSDEASREFLLRTAMGAEAAPMLRLAAVDALEERRDTHPGDVRRVAEQAPDVDTRRAAWEAFGRLGGPETQGVLEARWRDLESSPLEEDRDVVQAVKKALIVALAESGAPGDRFGPVWFSGVLESAAADFRVRCRGGPSPSTEFAWRAELHAAMRLAERGEVRAALAGAGPWWRADGRLLFEIAERVRGVLPDATPEIAGDARSAARDLYRAALIALAGEAPSEGRAASTFGCRFGLLLLAEERGDRLALAFFIGELLEDWRGGTVHEYSWRAALGSFDGGEGVDPPARLASTRLQSLARFHRDAGRADEARRACDEARARLGWSKAAREAQRVLEAELSSDR